MAGLPFALQSWPESGADMIRISLLVMLAACLHGRVGHGVETPAHNDRVKLLWEFHGYYPCMDCHFNQETNRRPRVLEMEHEKPLDWMDDDGVIHRVEFGERLPLAELLGKGQARGLRRETLERIGRRMNLRDHMSAQGLGVTDSIWVLTHGGGNVWCLDCHSASERDMLVLHDGSLLSFNESQRLCGQCHGPTLIDWDAGAHGRTNGYWNLELDSTGISRRLLCVECHNPHAPAFRGMMPLAGPVNRLDNISQPAPGTHRKETIKGTRDDMGPQPWQTSPRNGTSDRSREGNP
ncbi:MAG: hypothetical protein Q8O14_08480 [bacterium]|nr:hypothetical protein [bacterium]